MAQQTEQVQTKESPRAANPDTARIAPRPFPERAKFGKYSASVD